MKKILLFLLGTIIIGSVVCLFLFQRREIRIIQNERLLKDVGLNNNQVDELLSKQSPKQASLYIEEITEQVNQINNDLGIKKNGVLNWIEDQSDLKTIDNTLKTKNEKYTEKLNDLIKTNTKIINDNNLDVEIDEQKSLVEKYELQQYALIANGIRTSCNNQEIEGVLIVNKSFCLSENFVSDQKAEADAQIKQMINDANAQGIELMQVSGHRTFEYQTNLFNRYVKSMGEESAKKLSAWPGASEHQTGLAADFGEKNGNCQLDSCYENTPSGKWLKENAYKYGFILRYPQGKEEITGYSYEPWHYRYVGKELAKKINDKDITLEEYLGINYPIYTD